MNPVAILPIRSFSSGLTRLSSQLSALARTGLARGLASHVIDALGAGETLPLVITPDPEVAEWALRVGVPTLEDPGGGLDHAVAEGVAWANQSQSPWLAIHADLPLLTQADITKLTSVLENDMTPIAPSLDGGTSAIGGRGAFTPRYGPGSFHRHLATAIAPTVIVRRGLLHDVDSYEALQSAADHETGVWLRGYL